MKSDTSLTHFGHLRHGSQERVSFELGLVVVDVVNLDGEVGPVFQGLAGPPVHSLGAQNVVGLLLTVQALLGVDVARCLVDLEHHAGSIANKHIFYTAISSVSI